VKDFRVSGNTMTWRMVCTGEHAMEGEGEMTRTAAAFDGRVHMKMAQGEMSMKLRGKRLGGACDPEEQVRKAKALGERYQAQAKEQEAQAAATQARQCDEAVEKMQASAFTGTSVRCKDPAKKQAFCDRLRTEDGFARLMEQARDEKATRGMVAGPVAGAKACGADLEAVRQELCPGAARKERLAFLAASCPAEAKVIARRECAGRDYTALQGSRYRDFCARMKGEAMEADADRPARKKKPAAEDEAEKQDDGVEKGKKLLKGVLGF